MLTNNQFKKRFPKLFIFLNEIGYRNWKDYVRDITYIEDEENIDEPINWFKTEESGSFEINEDEFVLEEINELDI